MKIKLGDYVKTTSGSTRKVFQIIKNKNGEIELGIDAVGGEIDGMFCGYIEPKQIVSVYGYKPWRN